MRTLLTLVLLFAVGFAGSRGLVRRATHARPLAGLFATGAEFLVAGMLVGPGGLGLVSADVLRDLEPIVCLALGWAGMLQGIELAWEDVARVSARVHRALVAGTAGAIAVVGAAAWFGADALGLAGAGGTVDRRSLAMVLGVTAAMSSPTIVAVAAHRLRARGPTTHVLRLMSALGSVYPTIAFGALFLFAQPRVAAAPDVATAAGAWVLLNVAAVVMGGLMVVFAHERASDDEMLLVITGTVLMAGGLAFLFDVSALYTAMVMGFVVANASHRRDQIFRELHLVEKPLFVALCVYVGAVVGVPSRAVLVAAAAYVALRVVLRVTLTGATLARSFDDVRPSGPRAALGLVGQGIFAVAVALDFALASPGAASSAALAIVTLAVMADDAVGYALVARVLRAAGEASVGAPAGSGSSAAGGGAGAPGPTPTGEDVP